MRVILERVFAGESRWIEVSSLAHASNRFLEHIVFYGDWFCQCGFRAFDLMV